MGVSAADMSDSGVSGSRSRMWATRLASWSLSALCYRFLAFSKRQSCHRESVQVQNHEQKPLGADVDLRVWKLVEDENLLRCSSSRRRGGKTEAERP